MKTYILRLESQDDATSIRDKIAWAKAARILLAFPKRRPPAFSRLDLILIQRGAAQAGSQLAFVTHDIATIRKAKQLGIPVFSSIQSAQRLPWLMGNRKHRLPVHRHEEAMDPTTMRKGLFPHSGKSTPNWVRTMAFLLGVAAFLAVAQLFVPYAEIEVPLQRENQTVNMTIRPEVGVYAVLPGVKIPAAEVKTTISGQMEAITTGKIQVPDKTATATLLLTNQTDHSITIPAGTVFMALDPQIVRYLSQSQVELDAGIGQSAEVQVAAELPGTAGNVPAGAINTVNGPASMQIYVTNPDPAEGGIDRSGRAASDMDYSQMYDALITSLTETAVNNLEAFYGEDLIIISESMKVDQIVEDRRQPEVNNPADRAKLSLVVDFSGLAVSRADLIAAAAPSMDAALAKGKTADPDSYSFESLSAPEILSNGRIAWNVQISREVVQNVEYEGLEMLVRGREISDARQIIRTSLDLDRNPEIRISPSWWPRLPLLPYRIEVFSK